MSIKIYTDFFLKYAMHEHFVSIDSSDVATSISSTGCFEIIVPDKSFL